MSGGVPAAVPLCAVTLDAHGTLFHAPRMAEIYAEVLGRHGIIAAPDDLGTALRRTWEEFQLAARPERDRFGSHQGGAAGFWRRFVQRVCAHLGAPPPGPFAVAELYAGFARREAWEVYAEVPAALARLRAAGFALAVVSNWDERLPGLLDELGLGRHFAAAVFSQEVGVEKPHPAIFLRAAERLAVEPASVLHVGDLLREDVEGAEGAGMRALLLDRSGQAGGLRDLAQLAELVVTGAR